MDECVYTLIEAQEEARARPAMYRSKHRTLVPTCSTFGLQGTSKVVGNVAGDRDSGPAVHPSVKPTGSFGKPVAQSVNPRDFLKKTHAEAHNTSKYGTTFKRGSGKTKPDVPMKDDRPVMGLKTDKNFVVANAVESVLAAPKRPMPQEDRPLEKGNFGQVPGYLTKIKTGLKAQTNAASAAIAAQEADDVETMSEAEVEELRAGLNARHAALNKQYQALSFTLETGTQKRRKEQLEKSMSDIEQMLKKLSKRRVLVLDE